MLAQPLSLYGQGTPILPPTSSPVMFSMPDGRALPFSTWLQVAPHATLRQVQQGVVNVVHGAAGVSPLFATPEIAASPFLDSQARALAYSTTPKTPLAATPNLLLLTPDVNAYANLGLGRPSTCANGRTPLSPNDNPLGIVYSSSEQLLRFKTPRSTRSKDCNTPASEALLSPFVPVAESSPAYVVGSKDPVESHNRPASLLEVLSSSPALPFLNPRAVTFTPRLSPALVQEEEEEPQSRIVSTTSTVVARTPRAASHTVTVSIRPPDDLPTSARDPTSGFCRMQQPFADHRWWESVTGESAKTVDRSTWRVAVVAAKCVLS
ncbi:hypothetical protein EXIGLDRAFT_845399 [Exidia glandulosa HHB12029]|uniref:Uncharacterized protein n=1 Tax=Exidia glandulosa HHB12029 TaxID=1314781 RepID=A0A165BGK3_EXIGL|nr:hypothetical protein EXIGLDRAFT_845399 [Exidia glandulosa HHB12029]